MDREIIKAIDKRRKRTPKELEEGDMIVLRAEAHNAL